MREYFRRTDATTHHGMRLALAVHSKAVTPRQGEYQRNAEGRSYRAWICFERVATAAYTITPVADGKVLHGNRPASGAHVYLQAANTSGYGDSSVSLLNPILTGASDRLGGYVKTAVDGSFTISVCISAFPIRRCMRMHLEAMM